MKFLEFAHQDNAYQVVYEVEDASFSHAFGIQKEKQYDIIQAKMHCPVLDKNEWIPMVVANISSNFMDKILKKIHEAEEYRSVD